MDVLKAEIAKRKAAASVASSTDGPPPKYIKRGDLERAREVKYLAEQRQRDEVRATTPSSSLLQNATKLAALEETSGRSLPHPDSEAALIDPTRAVVESSKPEAFNISSDEAIRRLRAKGQPVRLFGESDRDRRLRLRALELIEERGTEGQRNDFMRTLEQMDQGLDLEELARRASTAPNAKKVGTPTTGSREASAPASGDEAAAEKSETQSGETLVDLSLIKSNPSKLYPQIYYALKKVLKEWEQSMNERSDHVKRSTQGKQAAATQKQSAEYLKPLFKSLRKRDLAPDVLSSVAEIVHNMQQREYLRANDAYLRLSIGNAPWPIGVTMVGIHERSAREKIFSNSVAHVLNDEVSRKYIQSLKRLLTFAQTIRPPDDLSQRLELIKAESSNDDMRIVQVLRRLRFAVDIDGRYQSQIPHATFLRFGADAFVLPDALDVEAGKGTFDQSWKHT